MAKRLNGVFLAAAFMGTLLFAACSDGDTSGGSDGEAGEPGAAGSPADAGATGSGGSSAGSGGSSAGSGGSSAGSGGSAGDAGGEAGQGGDVGLGGATGGGGEAGVAGAGGSPVTELDYACGQENVVQKFCSAATALNCPAQADCPDCVTERTTERATFQKCAPCLAMYDKALECAVGPFEEGNPSGGLECVEDYGADINEGCYNVFLEALRCTDYPSTHDDMCPPDWPLP